MLTRHGERRFFEVNRGSMAAVDRARAEEASARTRSFATVPVGFEEGECTATGPAAVGPAHPKPVEAGHTRPKAAVTLPPGSPRVSVVIPAKNEARNLPRVLAELPAGLHEVILVDGASVDGTVRTALRTRPDIVVVDQTRRGKGNALACGIAASTGDVIVTLDADGSADPAEIADFVAPLVAGADYAKGSRFLPGGGSSDLTRVRRLGNGVLAFAMNRIYRTSFSDLCYGYNAFWSRCVETLALPPVEGTGPQFGDGFEIETLLATHVANARLTVAEVPSYERERRFGESNLNTWRDGWRVLRTLVRERHGAPPRSLRRRPARGGRPFRAGEAAASANAISGPVTDSPSRPRRSS